MTHKQQAQAPPSLITGEDRAIRASGVVAGATLLGGVLGALFNSAAATVIGAVVGTAFGVCLALASAWKSNTSD